MRRRSSASAREELIDQLLALPALGRGRAGATGTARFSATVRLGNTFSRSGTSAMPSRVIVVRRPVLDALALEGDAALGDPRIVDAEEAGDGAQRGGLAGAVGAEQRDDLAARDRERDALQRRDGAVIDHLELVDAQQRRRSFARLRPPGGA